MCATFRAKEEPHACATSTVIEGPLDVGSADLRGPSVASTTVLAPKLEKEHSTARAGVLLQSPRAEDRRQHVVAAAVYQEQRMAGKEHHGITVCTPDATEKPEDPANTFTICEVVVVGGGLGGVRWWCWWWCGCEKRVSAAGKA